MEIVKKELITFRIPKDLNEKFSELVAKKGVSKNAFIIGLINRELENNYFNLQRSRNNDRD